MKISSLFIYLFIGGLFVGAGMVGRAERCNQIVQVPPTLEALAGAASWPATLSVALVLILKGHGQVELTVCEPVDSPDLPQKEDNQS